MKPWTLLGALFLVCLAAATPTRAADDVVSDVALSDPALAGPTPADAVPSPAGEAEYLQRRPRCEMGCRRGGMNCARRCTRECGGDLQCLRDCGNRCMDSYRGCRQDQCGSTADDVPLPRLPIPGM